MSHQVAVSKTQAAKLGAAQLRSRREPALLLDTALRSCVYAMLNDESWLSRALSDHVDAVQETVAMSAGVVREIVIRVCDCLEGGGKLLIVGNGGSAADAQHLAAEFMNQMRVKRQAWPAIALTTDSSVLTSIANDSDYSEVFSRQLEALGSPGDLLFAISTSGASPNVAAAIKTARERKMVVVGFTGEPGATRMGPQCDLLLTVPSNDTPRIQECHEFLFHEISAMVEKELLDRAQTGSHDPS